MDRDQMYNTNMARSNAYVKAEGGGERREQNDNRNCDLSRLSGCIKSSTIGSATGVVASLLRCSVASRVLGR